ncbi:MAG: glycoside hydrolase family 32 protein [Cyclobacteriaceae bacterium]|nr:glycoside hydrolase family 32 protein [Cyclobacteriaceae bacterium]
MSFKPAAFMKYVSYLIVMIFLSGCTSPKQDWKLTPENIQQAYDKVAESLALDPFRPGFHLTPPAGCMGDPNGGIFHDGWYHIFYGQQPFAWHPGAWFWAHARSKDLLHWEHMPPNLTPAFDLGLNNVGSGSTMHLKNGITRAWYSASRPNEKGMHFWQADFTRPDLSQWEHKGKNPILSLDHPGLPAYDGFWRDPFVFSSGGRTFLIACADLLEEDFVPVPIFEALNEDLSEWEYKGNLLTVPKHKYRNLEVPELRPLGDTWIFMASVDAPVDRCIYFTGEFDLNTLTFSLQNEGIIDYSGHYYAQESILNDQGNLHLMGWMPGWDRDWLPTYMNEPLKNENKSWNGCFALPRKLSLDTAGRLIQQPVTTLRQLRSDPYMLEDIKLPVDGPMASFEVLKELQGNQLEIMVQFDLLHAAFCGINVLSDADGKGGLFINWSGNMLNVDGVMVPLDDWKPGELLELHMFVDKKFVEVFVNGGRYCITRQLQETHVKGDHIALTSLGGTAIMRSLQAWKMRNIEQ